MKLNLLPLCDRKLSQKWWAKRWRHSSINRFRLVVVELSCGLSRTLRIKETALHLVFLAIYAVAAAPLVWAMWNWVAVEQLSSKPIGFFQAAAVTLTAIFIIHGPIHWWLMADWERQRNSWF